MIYVTHDQVEATTLADRIVVLNSGFVEQEGPPLEWYERPANRFVAGFLGQPKMNLLRATALAAEAGIEFRLAADGPAITVRPTSAGFMPGETVELGIRPDAMTLKEKGGLKPAWCWVERLGGFSLVHARVEGLSNLITVELPGTWQNPRLRSDLASPPSVCTFSAATRAVSDANSVRHSRMADSRAGEDRIFPSGARLVLARISQTE